MNEVDVSHYFDFCATTPLCDVARDAMMPFLGQDFYNPNQKTFVGSLRVARKIEDAHQKILMKLCADENDHLIFTSGATESNNLVLRGLCEYYDTQSEKIHIVTTAVEHASLLNVALDCSRRGHEVTVLPVNRQGQLSAEDVLQAIKPHTKLVSIMSANNETGDLFDVISLAKAVKNKFPKLHFHSDMTQSCGKMTFDIKNSDIDSISFSAHKFYGPKGCGGLWLKKKSYYDIKPQILGGGQQNQWRGGTLSVAPIIGMAEALDFSLATYAQKQSEYRQWQHGIYEELSAHHDHLLLNTDFNSSMATVVNISVLGLKGEEILLALPEYALSTGSACQAHLSQPSHVLMGRGYTKEEASASLRLSWGHGTTPESIKNMLTQLSQVITQKRRQSLSYEMLTSLT